MAALPLKQEEETPIEPQEKPKSKRGGKREGAGRPKRVGSGRTVGAKSIYSHEAVKKLEQMGFDPIEEMIALYNNIKKTMKNGTVKEGTLAHSNLTTTLQKIINDLMQYGYKKVPEKNEIDLNSRPPLAIKLNMPANTSNPVEE
jgi:hypothetical protein